MSSIGPLISLSALEVAVDEGVVAHLGRLDEALATPLGDEDRQVVTCVRDALGINVALLRQQPDALWPCLSAHAAFFDSPAAHALDLLPGLAEAKAALGIAPADAPVTRQLERWSDERARLWPGRLWVRALTPTTPPWSGLVAELRGIEGAVAGAVEADVVVLETAAGTRAWNIRTGELSPAVLPPAEPVSFTLHRAGGARVSRRGRDFEALGAEWRVHSATASRDGRSAVLVATEDFEATFAIVVDLERQRERSRAEVTARSPAVLSPRGAFLALQVDDLTVVRALDGSTTWSTPTPAATSLAVSDDGQACAVCAGGVVSLFRRPRRHPRWPEWETPTLLRRGHPAVQFSPDGQVALLGSMLCDARTGSLHGSHGYVHRQYLEGGPPPRNVRLTNSQLCVAGGGVQTWSLAGGVRRRNAPPLYQRHRIAFSADGLVFAWAAQGDERTTIATGRGERVVESRGTIEDLALDTRGDTLAVLRQDGVVELHPGLEGFRRVPGAEEVGFLPGDTAIVVSGPGGTVVLRRDGTELWRSSQRWHANNAGLAWVERAAGLRAPSLAERAVAESSGGITRFRVEGEAPPFPSSGPWVPSPTHDTLLGPSVLVRLER